MKVPPDMGICSEMKIKKKLQVSHIANDELAVVVIGGPSQGESILLHYGDGRWLIVDSCTSDKQNLPLLFLEKIEADLDKVGFIICSHWHDDHMAGMDNLLKMCKSSYFMIPCVTNKSILPRYFEYRIYKSDKENEKEAWQVFKQCLEIIKGRTHVDNPNLREPQFVKVESSILDYHTTQGIDVTVKALSPSNDMMIRFGEMLADGDARGGVFDDNGIDQNMCSISLDVSFSGRHLFLGADLECNRNDDEDEETCIDHCEEKFGIGMCNAVSNRFFQATSPYCYTKLIHHSSKNGYCPKYWNQHVTEDNLAISTIFSSQSLPRKNMVAKYLAKSSRYYITSRKSQKKIQKSDISRVLGANKYITSLKHVYTAPGIVITRYNMSTGECKGTETYLNAFQVSKSDLQYFEL